VEPILFIVTGPSGAGKGTVMRALLERVPDLQKVVTYTTRPPRPGEQDGFDYHFVDPTRFMAMVRAGEIFEYERVYHDFYYGSPRNLFPGGSDGLMELDYKGHQKYRALLPQVVAIFLLPPSLEELRRRILGRSEVSNLDARLKNAVEQLRHAREYDYVVTNDDWERCAERVATLMQAERWRRQGRGELAAMLEEIEANP
jgi:guanylate kinase